MHALLHHCGESLSGIGGVLRPGIVHRLDKDTSGLIVVAKGDEAHWRLQRMFARHDVERVYAQRLPTPGYDAFTDATLGAGTAAAVANGFGADSPFNSDLPYDIEQYALFGEMTYDLLDDLHLTVGGRYYNFEEKRTITTGGLFANGDSGTVDRTESDGFTPRVLVSFDVNDDVTVNAQASRGFRLGGVNDPLNPALCTAADRATFGGFQSYDDETLWNYELGVKARFNRITVNAALFHSEIEDLQVTLDAGSCSSRISFNVDQAHTTGFEWEVVAEPVDSLQLTFNGSLIEAEFDDTVIADGGGVLGGVKDGNRLASVPELQLSGSATWFRPTELFSGAEFFISGTVQYVGDRFTQPSDQVSGAGVFTSGLPFGGATGNEVTALDLELDPYTLLNVRAGFRHDDWEAALYVNNLTDENADLSFDRERGGRARLGFRTNTPRMVGAVYRRYF